tara:strand:- start:1180 stop:1461 length:282 start_codon:yes stop_codon:yes gene_type:complete
MSYKCISCEKEIEVVETGSEEKILNPKKAVMLLSYAAYGSKFDYGKTSYNYSSKVSMFFMCDDCFEKNISMAVKLTTLSNGKIEPAVLPNSNE